MDHIIKFLILAALTNVISLIKAEEESCVDIDGLFVEHGLLYVPGPNVCTQCVCHHSEPKWCQTMFCNGPPYMCKTYNVGKTCCQFECLDPPTEKPIIALDAQSSSSSATFSLLLNFSVIFVVGILIT